MPELILEYSSLLELTLVYLTAAPLFRERPLEPASHNELQL